MRFLGPGLGRRLPRPSSEEEAPDVPRVPTPVYRSDPLRSRRVRAVAKTADDQLAEYLFDGQFREARDVAARLPSGQWEEGVRGCLRRGYAFDRDGSRLRMRRRGAAETVQTFYEVVDGISASDLCPVVEVVEEAAEERRPEVEVEQGVGGGGGAVDEVEVPVGGSEVGPRVSLSVGDDPLELSLSECATMTAGILAKKSSGKTYLAMVVVEEILKSGAGVPVVVVDPTGVWSAGLRCMADGTPSPHSVLTLGGPRGDLPLASSQGREAAEVVERVSPHPVVLDLSELVPADQHRVVADFAEEIFSKHKRAPMLLVIDEADEFAPQTLGVSPHQRRSLENVDRIVRRGRIKGLGSVLITQRPAVISKNVLSQVDKLFLLCMVAPADLGAVEDWLQYSVTSAGQRQACLGQLPSMQPGSAFYLSSGAAAAFRKFQVRRRDTYDSSRTPDSSDVESAVELSRVSPEVLDAARAIVAESVVEEGGE